MRSDAICHFCFRKHQARQLVQPRFCVLVQAQDSPTDALEVEAEPKLTRLITDEQRRSVRRRHMVLAALSYIDCSLLFTAASIVLWQQQEPLTACLWSCHHLLAW